ncbi:MAG: tRNA pseudouridine(55) synthase TruB [Ferruginibacter sp.]
MAKKETYYAKHKAMINGADNIERPPVKNIQISEAAKADFEAGKVILVDKPLHWTSFDVVRKIRNSIRIRKVGHAGTLDPLATGLLIVCTGKFTKKINEFMAQEKEYTGAITLGATTATYDLESLPENKKDTAAISTEQIYSATTQFIGEIQQLPPIYSAIKKDGVPLYQLARRGEEVELKPRTITITQFQIVSIEMPVVRFEVTCSTGTYIRSLANDFGNALGCGGYLSELRRTKIGEHNVDNAVSMDQFINNLEKES